MVVETEPMSVRETGRLEALSDGIFAIVVTLIAIEIQPPRLGENEIGLAQALLAQWPLYFAFVLSFFTVGVMGMNHHALFRLIHRVDRWFLLANGFLPLGITLVPFITLLMADYIQHPEGRVAAMVYTGHFALIAVAFGIVWRQASRDRRLLGRPVTAEQVDGITRAYRFGPLFYLIAFAAAMFSVALSLGICLALAVFYALPTRGERAA